MSWLLVLAIILISAVKLFMTCLPTPVVEWLVSKFELHSKLSDSDADLTINGKHLADEEKLQVIQEFNEAIFIEKYYVHPGNQEFYLHPKKGETPLVIETKRGKKDVRLFVYSYSDHVDVVKQVKKKVFAYSLLSESLQKRSMLGDAV